MKVKELITLLEKEDPEKRIVVDGYEGGYDELKKLDHVCIAPNLAKEKDRSKLWYLGDFKECVCNKEDEVAVLLPRTS